MALIKPPLFTIMVETTSETPWLVSDDAGYWAPATITVGASCTDSGMVWATAKRASDFLRCNILGGNFKVQDVPDAKRLEDLMDFYKSNDISHLLYDPAPGEGSAMVLKIEHTQIWSGKG